MRVALAGFAFPAAVRVVDGVLRHAAHRRPNTAPALRAGLADLAQVVLVVADLADRGAAVDVHLAHLTGAQAHRDVLAFASDDLHRGARTARQLRALAGLHLETMHERADRNVLQRQRAAGFDRRVNARHDRVADLRALRRQDVAALAVRVEHERQVRRAVRIVLEPLDLARDAVLVALEIDDAVIALVPAALVPRRDAALIVAAAALAERLEQRLVRIALVQSLLDDADDEPLTRRCWFELA